MNEQTISLDNLLNSHFHRKATTSQVITGNMSEITFLAVAIINTSTTLVP